MKATNRQWRMWINGPRKKVRSRSFCGGLFTAAILFLSPFGLPAAESGSGWKAAIQYSRQTGHTALLVCQGGNLLHAEFSETEGRNTARPVFSITKALAGLLYLHAVSEEMIEPHEPVFHTLSEWKSDPARQKIQFDHLMNMTPGLDSRGSVYYRQPFPDKAKLAIRAQVNSAPGRYFAYGPAAPELFALLLDRKLKSRGSRVEDFLQQKILAPLGMDTSLWTRDGKEELFLSTGARMTPDQMLSLGRALLADGRRGFRRIVPQRIWRSFRSQTAPSLYYRSGFWFNVNRTLTHAREINPESAILESIPVAEWSKACLSRFAPCDLMAMVGSQGQRIYIVPSERLVIVRTGVGRKFDDREFLQRLRPLFRPG